MSPHFHCLCPPPHSSSPFHHIIPISSLAWMSPLLLHHLPPVQPLGWIFLIAHVLHRTRLHPSIASFPTSSLSRMSPHFHHLCPPLHSSSPFCHIIPISSLAQTSPLLLCHLPPVQPLSWIIFFTYVLHCNHLHPSISHLFTCSDVPPFSSPMSSATLVFTLLSLHLPHLFTCPDVLHCLPPLQPLSWIISCPFPPLHLSSPCCRFISHLFACPDVPPSPALPSTTPSLHFPHLFTCLDVLHHLPPLQPLGWIISCPSPPPHSSLPFHHFISHLFACPDVPPSPTLPSTTPIPRLEHFTAVMPQLALSCNMHLVSCY